jgi:hypothetical protein
MSSHKCSYATVFGVLCHTFFSGVTHGASCLTYEHQEVLSGKLVRETFPGPPNYESVRSGDQAETYFFLSLKRPVCTARGKSELEPAIERLKKIQIGFGADAAASYRRLAPAVGSTVRCEGLLIGSISGHHHTPVVLTDTVCTQVK